LTACFVQRPVQLIFVRRLALRAQACQDGEITVDLLKRQLAVIRLLNSQRLTLSPVSRLGSRERISAELITAFTIDLSSKSGL
jgi:hypothetical protein